MRGKRQASRKRLGVGRIASTGGGAAASRKAAGTRLLPRGGEQKKPKRHEAKLLRKLDADDESSQQSRLKKPQHHRDPAKRRRKKHLKGWDEPGATSTNSGIEERGGGGDAKPRGKPKLMKRKRRKPSEPGARKKPRGVKSETENQKMQSQRPPQPQHATKAEGGVQKTKSKRRRKNATGDAGRHVAAARRARLRGFVATETPS